MRKWGNCLSENIAEAQNLPGSWPKLRRLDRFQGNLRSELVGTNMPNINARSDPGAYGTADASQDNRSRRGGVRSDAIKGHGQIPLSLHHSGHTLFQQPAAERNAP